MTRYVWTNRRAVVLLGCLSVQRIAVAALPVVVVVAAADLRGYAAAATIQGVSVIVATLSAPFRARLLDRIGRHRVIVPQTVLFGTLQFLFGAAVIVRSVPIAVAVVAAAGPALTGPSMDSVIRTLWRTIGVDEHQVKVLHSYDSILEEIGFLAGPALASVLMLAFGQSAALFTTICILIAGYGVALASAEVRSALRVQLKPPAGGESPGLPGGRARRFMRTLAGPIASRELQRIVLPLILMGSAFGVVGILAPALCAAAGQSENTGFLLAAISLGGIIGALAYSALKVAWPLRVRHAALGIMFGVPLIPAFAAGNPWALGALLLVAGLAVTPLYINAYLMMDAEIPDTVIHEANTWVPVGNNVGYVIGISVGGYLLGRHDTARAQLAVGIFAAIMVAYSAWQILSASRARTAVNADEAVSRA